MNKRKKSLLAPTAFKLQNDHYILGDFVVSNLLVTEFPKEFYLGLLCEYMSDPNIKVFLTTKRLDMNIAALLNKDYRDKESLLKKTRDPNIREKLIRELDSMDAYIKQNLRNNDVTLNVILVFSVYAEDLKTLKERRKDLQLRLNTDGFRTTNVLMMQEMLMRNVLPIFLDDKLPKTIRDNLGIPLPSYDFAGLWPFVFETLKDPKGFLLGCEQQNGGIILFDPFYYLNNAKQSREYNRVNGNIVAVGSSGSGKTTLSNLILRNMILRKVKIIWIDPDNRNQVLAKRYGGTFINWGTRNARINVFDLKPISTDDDEINEETMWDTELSINNVIDDVAQVLQYLYPNLDEDVLVVLGDCVIDAYASVGIKKDPSTGRYPSFKGMSVNAMPCFTDLKKAVINRIGVLQKQNPNSIEANYLEQLNMKLNRVCGEWSVYLDGPTTIKKTGEREIIAFGTKTLNEKSAPLQAALNHIMFRYAWSECLDASCYSAFVIDEAHRFILEGKIAKNIAADVRQSRKYHNSMIVITQEPQDFADQKILTEGKAIFNNSAYKFIMNLNKDAANDINKLINLNESELQIIQQLRQGQAIFAMGNKKLAINVLATEAELEDMG